jgi:hypothetical protein
LTDPDPQFRTTGLRIRILLFLFTGFQDARQKLVFCLFQTVGAFTPIFKDNKLSGKQIINLESCDVIPIGPIGP